MRAFFDDVVVTWTSVLVLAYFTFVNVFYLVQFSIAGKALTALTRETRYANDDLVLGSDLAPRITVLVPAHDEQPSIVTSVTSMLTTNYPSLEVVVVDDGSDDETRRTVIDAFDMVPVRPVYEETIPTAEIESVHRSRRFPNLLLVGKANGGKADALNAALNIATGDLVCAVDADTVISPDALPRMVRPFITDEDTVAVGGTIRLGNGSEVRQGRVVEQRVSERMLVRYQTVEYLRAYFLGRVGWNEMGGNVVISGAFGLFRRDLVLEAGGYGHTLGEDIELVTRLRRRSYERGRPGKVVFVPDAVAWTEAPTGLRVLGRQRSRWHNGLTDDLRRHRRVLFRKKYGVLGWFVLPSYAAIEWVAPVIESTGFVVFVYLATTDQLNSWYGLLFLSLAYGVGIVLSLVALLAEELSQHGYRHPRDRGRLLVAALTESFGYQQLTSFWQCRGLVQSLRGHTHWGDMEHRGLDVHTTPADRQSSRVAAPVVPDDVMDDVMDDELVELPRAS